MPAIDLEYDRRLDLFSQDAWRVAKKLAAGFPNEAARRSIPVCHATYLDGSEQDLWAHFALQDQAFLLIEVSHSYIDHHFVSFKLWDTDQGAEREYPIDRLFQEEFFGEESSEHRKIGEIFVRPVTVAIHASKFNPSNLMPEENEIERMVKPVGGFPLYKFWRDFESGDYTQAANILFILLDQLAKKQDSIDGYVSFVRSVYAVCKYQAGEYELAAELFMSSGKEYLQLGS